MEWWGSPRGGGVRSAWSRQNKKLKGLKRQKDSEFENCKAAGMNGYMRFSNTENALSYVRFGTWQ